jgi:Multicopper oxidase
MERREFLMQGGAGLLATAGTLAGVFPAEAASVDFKLVIADTWIEQIDGQKLRMLSFCRSGGSPGVPGPVIRVTEGDLVTIEVDNTRYEPHRFEIGGVPGATLSVPGRTKLQVTFSAPAAGTYMYFDGSHYSKHLYRILGLHGAFIVHPRAGASGKTANQSQTPYSLDLYPDAQAVQRVSAVFDAFGTNPRFPGSKWAPCALDKDWSIQERIWLFSEIDPKFCGLIGTAGVSSGAIAVDAAAVFRNFAPRYFTINGKSGYDLSDAYDVVIKNYIGEPTLIRTMNVGLAHHATHIHGNHLFELAHSIVNVGGAPVGSIPIMGATRTSASGDVILHDNIWERDVWPTWPMQIRDMLLPLEAPPDIPNWQKFHNKQTQEPFPLRYVMHDHCEMGTTAAGGNYPQGAVTHWQVVGPLGGRSSA